jgi:hypothetical protein
MRVSNFYWNVLLLAASAAGNNQGVRAVESSNLLPIDQVSPSCLISIRSNENFGTISLTTLVFSLLVRMQVSATNKNRTMF